MPFNPAVVQDFIGNGLTFPIQLTNGKANIDSGFNLIRASIKTILAYTIGTRYFLGEFGGRLEELLEEPDDEILHNLINTFVIDAVTTWEKRIQTISTSIQSVDEFGTVNVKITYQVINSNTVDNFIYPFYTQIIF